MKAAERSAIRRPNVRGLRMHSVSDSVYQKRKIRRHACRPGTRSKARLHPARIDHVLARQEPVAGALEDAQAADPRGDLGDELDGARAVAHDRHALAVEVVGVVPFGRVEAVAGEALRAGQVGDRGLVELAGGDHDRVGLVGVALAVAGPSSGSAARPTSSR